MPSSIAVGLPMQAAPSLTRARSRWQRAWPLPALAVWALTWLLWHGAVQAGLSPLSATVGATLAGVLGASVAHTRTRRLVVALGFPLSLAALGVSTGSAAWVWLLPALALLAAYPVGAWRDAPLFPTPVNSLTELARAAPLPPQARVLDAGCGLGHGLAALRRAYPAARLEGIERSAPIAWLARVRQARARIHRGDMWDLDWSGYALVYLFQRPETLPRALAKARHDMAAGGWLASLEFEAAGEAPTARLATPDGRALWLYRITPRPRKAPQAGPVRADKNGITVRSGGRAVGR